MQHYRLRFTGLNEKQGQIKVEDLVRTMDALVTTAERATLLLAVGEGRRKGQKPQWLAEAVNFTVSGLKTGSTVLELSAPSFGDVAQEVFSQQDFWPDREMPDLGETSLDMVAKAIGEAQLGTSSGDHFDSSVLEGILKFKRITRGGIHIEMTAQDAKHGRFSLKQDSYEQVDSRLQALPSQKAVIASGQIDEIKYASGRFRMRLESGKCVLGRLDTKTLESEVLRPLWGKDATVQGTAHFKANGEPRLIVAHRLRPRSEGDEIFQTVQPAPDVRQSLEMSAGRRRGFSAFDPGDLAGTWPGDESIDELLDDLKES